MFFVIYNFAIAGDFSFPKINAITYTYYIVDYSLGFCTKLLPGAIYNALFSTTQADIVNIYVVIVYHIFLFVISLMLEKFLYKFDLENRFIAFIIVLFFITGPSTFSLHVVELGMIDTYWLFLSAAFLIMVQKKYLKWFVPIIFVLSIFIHISSMLSFIPFFALIILLEASRNEKVRKSYVVIFTISVLLSVAAFIYFSVFEESNLSLSHDSFLAFISERNISEWEDYTVYYDYSLYRISPDGSKMVNVFSDGENSFIAHVFGGLLLQIKEALKWYFRIGMGYYTEMISEIFLSVPIVVLLYKYVVASFKKESCNKLRRFVWFCTLFLLPFIFVTGALCSSDITRWIGRSVILLFAMVIYEIYRSADNDYLNTLNKSLRSSPHFAVFVYYMLYMICTVNAYWYL